MEHEVVQDGLGIGNFQNSEVYLKGSGKNSGWEYIYIPIVHSVLRFEDL